MYVKSLLGEAHLLKRPRKSQKIEFPRNWFEIGIILNDSSSSFILNIQIIVSLTGTEISKNPVIQPMHGRIYQFLEERSPGCYDMVLKPGYLENKGLILLVSWELPYHYSHPYLSGMAMSVPFS